MAISRDYGIVLLPDELTSSHAGDLTLQCLSSLKALNITNVTTCIPHLSLYQLRMNESDIPALMHEIKFLCADQASIHFKMDKLRDTKENVFWCSSEAKAVLKELHAAVIEKSKIFRDRKTEFSQVASADAALKSKYHDAIKQYGIWWGLPSNFDPHITLVYNSGEHENIQNVINIINLPDSIFKATTIAIAELGPAGEVIAIKNEHRIAFLNYSKK